MSANAAEVQRLIDGLEADDGEQSQVAAWLAHPLTLVEAVPAPFLHRYGIYRVMPRHLGRPVLRHVAGGADVTTLVLSPAGSLAPLLEADGTSLDRAEAAASCGELLIELRSPNAGLVRVVHGIEDIPFRDELDDDEGARRDDAERTLATRVSGPTATADGDSWIVSLWVARDGALQLEELVLRRDGDVVREAVVERHELPLIQVV